MSTSKVLKNSQPHQVKLREGSKNAQSKAVKAKTQAVPDEAPAQRQVKTSPVKVAAPAKAVKPVKVAKSTRLPPPVQALKPGKSAKTLPAEAALVPPVPALIAKKRTVKPKSAVQVKPIAADSSPKPTVTVPLPVARAAVPEHELWESDSPVMRRISLLRTRNAQLSEQVQRLKKPA